MLKICAEIVVENCTVAWLRIDGRQPALTADLLRDECRGRRGDGYRLSRLIVGVNEARYLIQRHHSAAARRRPNADLEELRSWGAKPAIIHVLTELRDQPGVAAVQEDQQIERSGQIIGCERTQGVELRLSQLL